MTEDEKFNCGCAIFVMLFIISITSGLGIGGFIFVLLALLFIIFIIRRIKVFIIDIFEKLYWKSLSQDEKDSILRREKAIQYIYETFIEFLKDEYNIPNVLNNTFRYDINKKGQVVRYWIVNNIIYFSTFNQFEKYVYDIVEDKYDIVEDNLKNKLHISNLDDENIKEVIKILKKFFDDNIISINKRDIEYFKISGEILHNITGGGSDLGGALVGGVLAGGAGAIIGSRNKIETEHIDNKRTTIIYNDKSELSFLQFDKDFYDVLLKWIPEKNYDYVALNSNQNRTKNYKTNIISSEELKELEVINKIKNKYNINNPEIAKSILEKCENIFKTDMGISFINELKRNCNKL